MKTDTANRLQSAINETKVLIAKEMKYSVDLRNVEKIQQYTAHLEKLEKILNG